MKVASRFKRLDLTDSVTEELWTEVHDIEQETVIKTIPKKINAKNQNGYLGRLTRYNQSHLNYMA